MKNYQKHIRFQNIQLTLNHQHPKDISRVHFRLIQNTNTHYQTKKYATISSPSIKWDSPIQFLYTAQQSFQFQTICEHQYGYQIQDLKALYSGTINVKPQDFFVINSFPIFNKETQNCGQLSFIIKIVDRQVGVKYNQEDPVDDQQRIKLDLVARITFLQAFLIINPLYIKNYEGKKDIPLKSNLIIQFGDIKFVAKQKQNKKWVFKGQNKVELLQKSPAKFMIAIKDQQSVLLTGQLLVQNLLKNKRFIYQHVEVSNQRGYKIGTLKLQLRVVQKKQILDLMYSPRRLQNIKMQKTDFQTELSRVKQNFLKKHQNKSVSSEPVLNLKKRFSYDARSKNTTFLMKLQRQQSSQTKSTSKISKNEKYNKYLKNRYQEVKFPQSKRFNDSKPNNPYISYTGQQHGSDFSPKNKSKGADFSKTQRTDFTKPFKNHPGTGDYRLPSIWQKS